MWITSGWVYNFATAVRVMPEAPVGQLAACCSSGDVSEIPDCGVSLLDAPSEVVANGAAFIAGSQRQLAL